jgi:hypothetical protein
MLADGVDGIQAMDKFKLQFGLITPEQYEETTEVRVSLVC